MFFYTSCIYIFATGVSERFVYKLMNEKKKAEESNVKLSTPGKNRERKTGKLDMILTLASYGEKFMNFIHLGKKFRLYQNY